MNRRIFPSFFSAELREDLYERVFRSDDLRVSRYFRISSTRLHSKFVRLELYYIFATIPQKRHYTHFSRRFVDISIDRIAANIYIVSKPSRSEQSHKFTENGKFSTRVRVCARVLKIKIEKKEKKKTPLNFSIRDSVKNWRWKNFLFFRSKIDRFQEHSMEIHQKKFFTQWQLSLV